MKETNLFHNYREGFEWILRLFRSIVLLLTIESPLMEMHQIGFHLYKTIRRREFVGLAGMASNRIQYLTA